MPAQWAPESDSERDTPSVLLRLALWSSLTSNHLVSLMNIDKNRDPREWSPVIFQGLKKLGLSSGEEGKRSGMSVKSWDGGAF